MESEASRGNLEHLLEIDNVTPVDAGHMSYDKVLVDTSDGESFFVKTYDPSLLTDEVQKQKMWEYLIKEQYVYDILGRSDYSQAPEARLQDTSLILEACPPEKGWHWGVPESQDLRQPYINDVLGALMNLQTVKSGTELDQIDPDTTLHRLLNLGWGKIDSGTARDIEQRVDSMKPKLHPHILPGIELVHEMLQNDSPDIFTKALESYSQEDFESIAHFDARQSNIAWHAEQGVKIVDWSWASSGPTYADTTMFLIDLHKSHVNVDNYLADYFDKDHAVLQIGYWLARSIVPPSKNDTTIRFHQVASAVSAADLLLRC